MLYASAGRPTAAILTGKDVLIDYKLFWIPCETQSEAQYLVTVINSRILEEAVGPLMPKGQFGARDVVKHIWRLPIPEYDEENALHRGIAQAGAIAAEGAAAVLRDLRTARAERGQDTSVTVARREIRKWLAASNEGQEVERLVARLLG